MTIPESGTDILLKVHPNAGRDEILGVADGVLQVKIAAPPVKGRANARLVAFLSRLAGVSQSRVSIVRGHTGRNKIITIDGVSREEIMRRLSVSGGGARE
ncbi:DUF167 domain-containing protein [Chloroflexota bacterium]